MGSVLTSLRTGLLLLMVLVSGRAALADAPYSDARFWRIDREGAEPSFILGTMHVTDPEVTALPPEVRISIGALTAQVQNPSPRCTYA